MKTIRRYINVENNELNIVLPKDFNAKRVEVIIISEGETMSEATKLLLDERILHHANNPEDVVDFDEFLIELEGSL